MTDIFPEFPPDPTNDPRQVGSGQNARWYDPIRKQYITAKEAESHYQTLLDISREKLRTVQDELLAQEKLEGANKRVLDLFTKQKKELEQQLKDLKLVNKENEIMFASSTGEVKSVDINEFLQMLRKAKQTKDGLDLSRFSPQERETITGVQSQIINTGLAESGGGGHGGRLAGALGAGAVAGRLLGGGGGGEGGFASTAAGHLVSHKLGIPFIGPLVSTLIRGALNPKSLPFAGLSLFELGAHEYRQQLQSGRITGEGFGAGAKATLHGVREGINPFDLISMQTAIAIETGVRSQGFKDKFANAMSDTVGDVVNRLGIDYKQAIDLLTTSVRQGNESLVTFRASMQDVAQIAKDSSIGVANLVNSIKDLQDFTVQTGGASGVQFSATAVTAFARTFGNAAGLGSQGGKLLSEAAPMLAPMMGVPSILAGTRRGIQATGMALDNLLPQVLAMKPEGMSMNDWAAMQKNAGVLGQIFPTASVSAIERMMSHYAKPGAPKLFGSMQRRQAAQAREAAQTSARLARKGIEGQTLPRGVFGIPALDKKKLVTGEKSFISTLRSRLQEAGLSANQVRHIIAPLESSVGNSSAFNSAASAQALTGPNGSIMKIGLTPEAKRLFKVEGLTSEINRHNFYLGRGPSQNR